MLQQQHDAVADQVHRRLEARADDQRGVGSEFAVGQRAVGGHAAERIVALLAGAQSVEVLEQVIVGAAQPVDGVAVGLPVDPDVQQRGTAAAPPQHARIRITRQAKDFGDNSDRQLHREVGDQIGLRCGGDALDQLHRHFGDSGVQ